MLIRRECKLFGNGKDVSLRHVVLDPEVRVVMNVGEVKGVYFWEEITSHRSEFSSLRRVLQLIDHESYFSLICS